MSDTSNPKVKPKNEEVQNQVEIDLEEVDVIEEKKESNVEAVNIEDTLQEVEEKYRRALADYRNLEYRVREERMQYVKLANRNLVESLLEPLDFMETATKHIDDKGLQMVVQRFYQVLNMEGLEEISIKPGEPFDEKTMEAVGTAEGEPDTVITVQQKGFRLNGVVIRHARVIVGK